MIVITDEAQNESLRAATEQRQGSLRGISEILRDVLANYDLRETSPSGCFTIATQSQGNDAAAPAEWT